MNTTDPIADMLTRIRNASNSKHKTVDIPASNMKKSIANILFREGYIDAFEEIEDKGQGTIRITLKYDEKGAKIISIPLILSTLSYSISGKINCSFIPIE